MGLRNTRAQRVAEQRRRAESERTVVIPKCRKPRRRAEAERSLWAWAATYCAHRMPLPSAPVHMDLASDLDAVVRSGGNIARVLPRGSAKTTWMELGAIYAVVTGMRRHVVIVSGTGEMAEDMLTRIRGEVEANDLLEEDYPEVCVPIRALEGSPMRAKTMLIDNGSDLLPISFEWKTGKAVFPRVPGSRCCGSIIVARGIEGNLRGMIHKLPSGQSVRPDLVLVDDPQTRESAGSPVQCRDRIDTINGDLLGLAGPNTKIAAMVAATIIRRGDVADQLTDTKLSPAWGGKRVAMVSTWAKNEALWMDQYATLRKDAQRAGDAAGKDATEFYAQHRAEMDEGCSVYWPARYNADEISAVQHAYNLLIDRGEHVFFAEYQNDPKPAHAIGWELVEEDVRSHLSGVPRGRIPDVCEVVTFACDINPAYGLNWVVSAYSIDGAGYVIDWGKYPSGDVPIWDAKKSSVTEEQAIFQAILNVYADVANRSYQKANGERVRMSCASFDCGYKREAVYKACAALRTTAGQTQVIPIRGMSGRYYRPRSTDRRGDSWHIAAVGNGRALVINADTWRERAQKAFLAPVGSPCGSLALYGNDARQHEIYADHVCAERIVDILHGERGGIVYAWAQLPGRKNDLLDATVYAMACASHQGVTFGPNQAVSAHTQPTRAEPQPAADTTQRPHVQVRRTAHHAAAGRRKSFATSW